MTDRRNLFNKPITNDERTNNDIVKITNSNGGDYTTDFLVDYR